MSRCPWCGRHRLVCAAVAPRLDVAEGKNLPAVRTSPLTQIAERYEVDENGCWLWTGSFKHNGYGRVRSGGKETVAHRYAYELVVGRVPDGLVLDHLCRNRACINPDHVEPVTNKENILRGAGITAVNARKTHCIRGHEFTPENTYRTDKGRWCVACREEAAIARRLDAVRGGSGSAVLPSATEARPPPTTAGLRFAGYAASKPATPGRRSSP